jgi:uncharacterized membrane protein YoaK (UPF0700 family)
MSALSEARHTLWPARGDRHGPLPPLLVTLTFVTGVVDATSYLRLGHVFVANMTGNVVFLGFALAGAHGMSAAASLIALAAFLAGALAGGRIGAHYSDHRGRVLRGAGAAQAALMTIALLLAALAPAPLDRAARYGLIAVLAVARGIQNAAAQRLAVPDLTTTVLTRTLTGLATDATVAGGPGSRIGRRAIAISAMLTGALCGALLALNVSVAAAVALALAVAAAVVLAANLTAGSHASWTRPRAGSG